MTVLQVLAIRGTEGGGGGDGKMASKGVKYISSGVARCVKLY